MSDRTENLDCAVCGRTLDEHTGVGLVCPEHELHPTEAHKAACPICNPTKTVPELNLAYADFVREEQDAVNDHIANSTGVRP